MLTEFFVANESDVSAVAQARPPAKKWTPMFAKDLDQVKLGHLWTALGGKLKQPLLRTKLVHTESEQGPWVAVVPASFVRRVSKLSEVDRESAAQIWAEAEEFAMDGWKPADVLEALTELQEVCKRAQTGGKSLLLRIGL
jgi:hypothetical protein